MPDYSQFNADWANQQGSVRNPQPTLDYYGAFQKYADAAQNTVRAQEASDDVFARAQRKREAMAAEQQYIDERAARLPFGHTMVDGRATGITTPSMQQIADTGRGIFEPNLVGQPVVLRPETSSSFEDSSAEVAADPNAAAAAATDARAKSYMMPDGTLRMFKPGDEPKGATPMPTAAPPVSRPYAARFGDNGVTEFAPAATPGFGRYTGVAAPPTPFDGNSAYQGFSPEGTGQGGTMTVLPKAAFIDQLGRMSDPSGMTPQERIQQAEDAAYARGESIARRGPATALQPFSASGYGGGTQGADPAAESHRRNVLSDIAYQDRRGRGYQANVVNSMMKGLEMDADQGSEGMNDFQKAQMKAHTDAQPSFKDMTDRDYKRAVLDRENRRMGLDEGIEKRRAKDAGITQGLTAQGQVNSLVKAMSDQNNVQSIPMYAAQLYRLDLGALYAVALTNEAAAKAATALTGDVGFLERFDANKKTLGVK